MAHHPPHKTLTLAITGASGAQYGLRLLACVLAAGWRVHLMISKAALLVIATETALKLPAQTRALQTALREHYAAPADRLRVFGLEDWFAPPASGSGPRAPMVICPCSTGTLSALATGASNNLIERAGDVALKERLPLILVPRETPYSAAVLENMLSLTRMGAILLPASPGFYQSPTCIEDLIDFVVARILDQLNIEHQLHQRWGDKEAD